MPTRPRPKVTPSQWPAWWHFTAVVAALAALAAVFPIGCILHSGWTHPTPRWGDEWLSTIMLTDPSLTHMMRALCDAINTSPPLYFLLGRVWVLLAGDSSLDLRMFSSLTFVAAFLVMIDALRRPFGFWPALIGVSVAFFKCNAVCAHNAEVRFYGMLVAAAALLIWCFSRVTADTRGRPPARWLIAEAFATAILLMTHYVGLLLLPIFFAGHVIDQLSRRRFDPRPFAALVAGTVPFLFWLPVFRIHQTIPQDWLLIPTGHDLLWNLGYNFRSPALIWGVLAATCVALYILLRTVGSLAGSTPSGDDHRATGLLAVGWLYVAFPLGVWIFSRIAHPLFHERYIFHALLGWAIVLAHLMAIIVRQLRQLAQMPRWSASAMVLRAGAALAGILLITSSVRTFLQRSSHPFVLVTPLTESPPQQSLPIAMFDSDTFWASRETSPARDRICLVLDTDVWRSLPKSRGGNSAVAILTAVHREYPQLPIVLSGDFLAGHPQFLFFSPDDSPWLQSRIVAGGRYTCTPLPCPDGNLYFVSRLGPS